MFLAKFQPQLAHDMIEAYSNTMRWYYMSGFVGYKVALEKVALLSVHKNDALGADTLNLKGTLDQYRVLLLLMNSVQVSSLLRKKSRGHRHRSYLVVALAFSRTKAETRYLSISSLR